MFQDEEKLLASRHLLELFDTYKRRTGNAKPYFWQFMQWLEEQYDYATSD